MPITAPTLNTFEPIISPMLSPGLPWSTEKNAITISGTDVITARITKPAEASLIPVSSINFSIELMVKWLKKANAINETARIINSTASSITCVTPENCLTVFT